MDYYFGLFWQWIAASPLPRISLFYTKQSSSNTRQGTFCRPKEAPLLPGLALNIGEVLAGAQSTRSDHPALALLSGPTSTPPPQPHDPAQSRVRSPQGVHPQQFLLSRLIFLNFINVIY